MAKQGSPIKEKTQQLYVFTGARGTGKTRLAASFLKPSLVGKMVYFDSEKSANNVRSGLLDAGTDFGMYVDLQDVEAQFGFPSDNDLLDRISKGEMPWMGQGERDAMEGYYFYILKQLASIPHGQYTVFVLDTAEKLENGMRAFCDKNRTRFGIGTEYGKEEIHMLRPLYEYLLDAIWARGFETIILNFHLRNVWDKATKRPVVNKVQMAGNVILYKRASLMLWLLNADNPNGEPAGLVIKERMGKFAIDNEHDEWVQRRMLPRRIPVCTWPNIARYLREGCDLKSPASGEVWSEEEHDMASEFLSNAQMALMLADLEVQKQETAKMLVEAGLINYSPSVAQDVPAKLSTEPVNGVPANKGEAIRAWTAMGKTVPELIGRMKQLGITDDQISARWPEIMG